MEDMTAQIIGIGVTVGLAGAGAIAGVLKWSLGRNLKAMDDKTVGQFMGVLQKYNRFRIKADLAAK